MEQIKALTLPFGTMEEAEEATPVTAPVFDAPSIENRPFAESPVHETTAGERQQLLSAPGYQLGRDAAPVPSAKPSADASDAKRFSKMPLILPKAAPKFERR